MASDLLKLLDVPQSIINQRDNDFRTNINIIKGNLKEWIENKKLEDVKKQNSFGLK